jgi:putative cell wall-binding protein
MSLRSSAVLALSIAVGASSMASTPPFAGAEAPLDPPTAAAQSAAADAPSDVPPKDRPATLGGDWASSSDLAWSVAGDATGLHVMAAAESTGYSWTTVASLKVVGIETDRWIGNACLTGDGETLAVVYAPRSYTNDEDLFGRGAFAALVGLRDGAVTDLGAGYTLAYFNPGCGVGSKAALTAYSSEAGRTRIRVADAVTAQIVADTEVEGQLTSATVAPGGIVAAASNAIVAVGDDSSTSQLAEVVGVPYDLRATPAQGLTFLTRDEESAFVQHLSTLEAPGQPEIVASGSAVEVTLTQAASGQVFATGAPVQRAESLPADLILTEAAARSVASSDAQLLLAPAELAATTAPGAVPDPAHSTARFEGVTTDTDAQLDFTVSPGAATATYQPPSQLDGSLTTGSSPWGVGSPTDPVEAERACAIPRNDPANQALQPKPRQVEWAADQAVAGRLITSRPDNWRNLGMAAYSPQGLFPRRTLGGGGTIPAQVVLGVLAQESNLWQASVYTTPGVTGTPLIGNYYGNDRGAPEESFWDLSFPEADCGYGVGQITDGMRLAGRERDGETALPAREQRAIALDYAANVAKAVQMLGDKWNQTRSAGLTINDGGSQYVENWFFAVWAYNTGFYPDKRDGSPWGVGWLNNPSNPAWDPSRGPFLDGSPADAARPQHWPYPEKVMGFAAHSTDLFEDADRIVSAFRPAQWLSTDGRDGALNRFTVKPPIFTFCNASNTCSPGTLQPPADPEEKPGPCLHKSSTGAYDLECWYHTNATWKGDCDSSCGLEVIRFDPGYREEPDAESFPPHCSTAGLPPGSLVVDELPNGTASRRPGPCPATVASKGSFAFTFGADDEGLYPSKMDLHQLGAGFNSHFYFAHTRSPDSDPDTYHGGSLNVTGTWTLGQSLTRWARVLVHLPDHGAWTQQALYSVDLGDGTIKKRMLLQRHGRNAWVSLGVFPFRGQPKISLSNVTRDGLGIDDVAWDAVAIQPLDAKPADIVVSMGDSFSSGEGASSFDGADYFRDSDTHGGDPQLRNACHRSRQAWSRKASVGATPTPIGVRADTWDPSLDYHMTACSSAETENLLPESGPLNAAGELNRGQYHELTQLDQGYLDENTTLVTLSVGGNDAGFADIIKTCIEAFVLLELCKSLKLPGDTTNLEAATAYRTSTEIPASVATVLKQIQLRAPNARILLMGYPALFETGSLCALVKPSDVPWLQRVTADLSNALLAARNAANSTAHPVIYADPRPNFSGTNLCTPAGVSSNTGLVFHFTPGDQPIFSSGGKPVSQQSFHPNLIGTDLYARTMMEKLGDNNYVFSRIAGADRYSASAAMSLAAFPDGGAGAPVVWVASGEKFADALSAGPAAAQQGGPLLLTSSTSLPPSVKAEIQRLHPARIVLVGGVNSVSDLVRTELTNLAPTSRISGADRFEVSRRIAKEVFGSSAPRVYVATGNDFPDAVSAGAAAAARRNPVILVNGHASAADAETKAALVALGAKSITVVGGASSVTPGVVTSLGTVAPTTRLAGADRYAASLAASNDVYPTAKTVFIATGVGFPDALVGAALAARKAGPLFLVPSECLARGVLDRVRSLGATSVTILGGPNSVAEAVTLPTLC